MKKILAGMFFRLFKCFEVWVLLALMVICSLYFNYASMNSEQFLYIYHSEYTEEVSSHRGEVTVNVNKDNVEQFRFENFNVTTEEAYKYLVEPIDQADFDRLDKTPNYVWDEVKLVFTSLGSIHLLSTVLMIIFIPVFFGRMFSDGTVKNLISSGHTKAQIILSSVVLTFVLDIFTLLINIASFAVLCRYFSWQPPLYMPFIVQMLILALLMSFTATSLCISVLYISGKRTATFILGFLIAVYFGVPSSSVVISLVLNNAYYDYHASQEQIDEAKAIIENDGWNYIEKRYDYLLVSYRYYYKDKEVLGFYPEGMPAFYKALSLSVYLDPSLVSHTVATDLWYSDPYMVTRDGLILVNIACTCLWLAASTTLGIIIFNKREIHC